MKQCRGKGSEGNIPPTEYVPDCFVNAKTCNICGEKFETNSELRDHAKYLHESYVTKCWSKDALLNIGLYEQYETWLGENFKWILTNFQCKMIKFCQNIVKAISQKLF